MIEILDSHAYPGCAALVGAPPQNGPAHVQFSDGTVAGALVERVGEGRIALKIDGYRTGKGTAIAPKSWLLEHAKGDRWRVRRRIDRD